MKEGGERGGVMEENKRQKSMNREEAKSQTKVEMEKGEAQMIYKKMLSKLNIKGAFKKKQVCNETNEKKKSLKETNNRKEKKKNGEGSK